MHDLRNRFVRQRFTAEPLARQVSAHQCQHRDQIRLARARLPGAGFPADAVRSNVGLRDGVAAHHDPRCLIGPDRDASIAGLMSHTRFLLRPLIQFRTIRLERVEAVVVGQCFGAQPHYLAREGTLADGELHDLRHRFGGSVECGHVILELINEHPGGPDASIRRWRATIHVRWRV